MHYRNDARPAPAPVDDISPNAHQHTSPEEYDLNFEHGQVGPFRTDKIELRPFIPSLHAQSYLENIKTIPGIKDILSLPLDSLSDVLYWVEKSIRRNPNVMEFAIFVNPSSVPSFPPSQPTPDSSASPETATWLSAGRVVIFSAAPSDLSFELGIIVWPAFQSTVVASHAVGLMMKWVMRMPDEGGLGWRRLQWTTQVGNGRAQGLARKMGFGFEGVRRCEHVIRTGQRAEGHHGREGDKAWGKESRDTWSAGLTYEDWEGGVRDHVEGLLKR